MQGFTQNGGIINLAVESNKVASRSTRTQRTGPAQDQLEAPESGERRPVGGKATACPGCADLSLKRKLILITMLTSSTMLLLAGGLHRYDLDHVPAGHDGRPLHPAQVIGNNSTAALIFRDAGSAGEVLGGGQCRAPDRLGCILHGRRARFVTYERDDAALGCPSEPLPDGHRFVGDHLEFFRRIVLDGEAIGTVYLRSDMEEDAVPCEAPRPSSAARDPRDLLPGLLLSSRLQRVISEPIRDWCR